MSNRRALVLKVICPFSGASRISGHVVTSASAEPACFDLSEQFLTRPPGSNSPPRNQMTNIFVGNLSYQTTEQELQAAFANYGAVERANVVRDRETGQPRGFAFIEMTNRN